MIKLFIYIYVGISNNELSTLVKKCSNHIQDPENFTNMLEVLNHDHKRHTQIRHLWDISSNRLKSSKGCAIVFRILNSCKKEHILINLFKIYLRKPVFELTHDVYHEALRASIVMKDYELFDTIWIDMKDNGYIELIDCSSVLFHYINTKQWGKAKDIQNLILAKEYDLDIDQDSSSSKRKIYDLFMVLEIELGNWEKVVDYYSVYGEEPTLTSASCVAKAYTKTGKIKDSLKMFNYVESNMMELEKSFQTKKAKEYARKQKGVLFEAMLESWLLLKRYDSVVAWYNEMIRRTIPPTEGCLYSMLLASLQINLNYTRELISREVAEKRKIDEETIEFREMEVLKVFEVKRLKEKQKRVADRAIQMFFHCLNNREIDLNDDCASVALEILVEQKEYDKAQAIIDMVLQKTQTSTTETPTTSTSTSTTSSTTPLQTSLATTTKTPITPITALQTSLTTPAPTLATPTPTLAIPTTPTPTTTTTETATPLMSRTKETPTTPTGAPLRTSSRIATNSATLPKETTTTTTTTTTATATATAIATAGTTTTAAGTTTTAAGTTTTAAGTTTAATEATAAITALDLKHLNMPKCHRIIMRMYNEQQ
eukprot:Pgem_evm1s13978